MSTKTLQDRVDSLCTKLIRRNPEGARYRDLEERAEKMMPDINRNTLRGAIYRYGSRLPKDIIRPVRGLYITEDAWQSRDKSVPVPTRAKKYRRRAL